MKRKCVIPRYFSMILLAFLLSITLIACSSKEDNNSQETEKETIQQETAEEVEHSDPQTEGITVSGLNFNSTTDDVVKKLGTPSEIDSAPGVSAYYYGDGRYSGTTIYFIEDKVCAFIIAKDNLNAPKGIKVGDNIVKALREYYIPKELNDLGIKENDTDEEMLQKINKRNNCAVYLNDYKNSKIKLFFDLPSGNISNITISQVNAKNESVRLEASDFSAGAEAIAEKLGYPDDIIIFDEYAFEFIYADPSANIMFLKDSSRSENSFTYQNEWLIPYDIKIGDTIHDVFETLYIPDNIKNLGISLSMNNSEITDILNKNHVSYFRFNSLPDYSIAISIDELGTVYYATIRRFNDSKYSISRVDSTFEVPEFDKETIATKADLYLSGCKIGSTRQDVFQMLGSPQKTEAGYDEYVDKYQDCYFKNAVVSFLSVGDYEDLKSGRAWHYYITDPLVIGPRGLRVGDNIEKVLEVFPRRDDIDFRSITDDTVLYDNPADPNEETNSATVYPSAYKAYTGKVFINVDWVYGITFEYEDGIITGMVLSEMLD